MRTVLLCALLLITLSAPALAGPLDITLSRGDLGNVITVELSGDPGELYAIVFSDDSSNMFKWISLTLSVPGLFGTLDGNGEATANLPIPGGAAFNNFVIYSQAATVTLNPLQIDDLSSICTIKLGYGETFVASQDQMTSERTFATGTQLDDDRVLIAGGGGGQVFTPVGLRTAEIYDPCSDQFTLLTSLMAVERSLHSAAKLQDGKVLVTGGSDPFLVISPTADVFDPVTNNFTQTSGNMRRGRIGHGQVTLNDGRVIVTGGSNALGDVVTFVTGTTNQTDIYDPNTDSFAAGPNMSEPKVFASATKLQDGRTLVSGGFSFFTIIIPVPYISSNAQILNVAGTSFSGTGSLNTNRVGHTSVVLSGGDILVAGGASDPVLDPATVASAERFNPGSGTFSNVGSMTTSRALFPLVRLGDGRVLAAGGGTGTYLNLLATNLAEIFDPSSNTWSTTSAMGSSRGAQVGLRLDTGRVLMVGGADTNQNALKTAELFIE
ncbi:MAG: kelch repeat-containing protein [Planctomycetota bacterium]